MPRPALQGIDCSPNPHVNTANPTNISVRQKVLKRGLSGLAVISNFYFKFEPDPKHYLSNLPAVSNLTKRYLSSLAVITYFYFKSLIYSQSTMRHFQPC